MPRTKAMPNGRTKAAAARRWIASTYGEVVPRPAQLADAFIAIASANHYMIGLTEPVTLAELDQAEQLLISKQNSAQAGSVEHLMLDLALDLLEEKRRQTNA